MGDSCCPAIGVSASEMDNKCNRNNGEANAAVGTSNHGCSADNITSRHLLRLVQADKNLAEKRLDETCVKRQYSTKSSRTCRKGFRTILLRLRVDFITRQCRVCSMSVTVIRWTASLVMTSSLQIQTVSEFATSVRLYALARFDVR